MWEELTSPLLPGVLPTLPSARLSSLEALDVGAVEELCDDPQRSFSKSSSVPCGAPVVPHESRRPKKWRTGLRVYLALNSVGSQATPRTSTKSTQTRSIYQIQCDEYRSKATVFKCSWCNVVFPHEDSLRKHYKSMHHKGGRHQCRLCPYSTETRSCLSAHERTHSGERPYACLSCSKAFRQSSGLDRHVRTVHQGERKHACAVCGQTFALKAHLQKHERLHTSMERFVCKHCGKRFSEQAERNAHLQGHARERPYRCESCGDRFAQLTHLQRHTVFVHTKDFQHGCEACGKRFYQACDLRRHTQKMHGNVT